MSEPDTLPSDVHHEMTLLPWYVNGTLAEAERHRLERHLPACPACRSELDDLHALRANLHRAYRAQPGPSPEAARTLLATIAREGSAPETAHPETRSSLQQVDDWFRSLFAPRWVPTLASLFLLTQVGLLVWVTKPAPEAELVTSRSLAMPGATLAVTFQPSATEEQIRAVLATVQGRIVDGPAIDGTYLIEVTASGESAAHRTRDMLRARQEIIRSVQPVKP